jgi:pheromone shutdown protein TraB
VQKAATSVRALYQNRVTRVFLVFILSSLGAALGAWVGLGWVLALL